MKSTIGAPSVRRSPCDKLPNPHLKPTDHKRPRQCARCGALVTEYATGESADNVEQKATWCDICIYVSRLQYWGNPARCK